MIKNINLSDLSDENNQIDDDLLNKIKKYDNFININLDKTIYGSLINYNIPENVILIGLKDLPSKSSKTSKNKKNKKENKENKKDNKKDNNKSNIVVNKPNPKGKENDENVSESEIPVYE